MKIKAFLFFLAITLITTSCSKGIQYSPEQIEKTSGRYLFNADDIIEVYYENNKLFLNWRGAKKMEPVALDSNTFFVPDIYKKLHFVTHPETGENYLSVISEEDENKITYDYLKVTDAFKTPSMHLKDKEYDKALAGFSAIRKQDSTSVLVSRHDLNRKGSAFIDDENYEDAIEIFKMNVALFPKNDLTHSSLASCYLKSGDSVQAYKCYKKALEFNNRNRRAKRFVEAYENK